MFGTAGVKILSSKDAKKVYTHCTAAALRAKECVMKTASCIQENAEDIYAEAVEVNEKRRKRKWNLKMRAKPMMISRKHQFRKYEISDIT